MPTHPCHRPTPPPQTNGTHVGSMASALIRPLVCNTSMLAVGNITQLRAAGLLEGVSEVDAATGGEVGVPSCS